MIALTIVLANWATTPHNAPITKGLYRYSRNPMYVTTFVFLLGLGIITASWILLLLFIVFVVGCVIYAGVEEQSCLDKYGDSYHEYMNRTPRWIGLPK
ncbi:methyltransferase family protein [Chloroflexota bacterium]